MFDQFMRHAGYRYWPIIPCNHVVDAATMFDQLMCHAGPFDLIFVGPSVRPLYLAHITRYIFFEKLLLFSY